MSPGDLDGARLELVRVARGEDGAIAPRRERVRNRRPEAPRGADDKHVSTRRGRVIGHGPLYSGRRAGRLEKPRGAQAMRA